MNILKETGLHLDLLKKYMKKMAKVKFLFASQSALQKMYGTLFSFYRINQKA